MVKFKVGDTVKILSSYISTDLHGYTGQIESAMTSEIQEYHKYAYDWLIRLENHPVTLCCWAAEADIEFAENNTEVYEWLSSK
jgi:hypothetical protein